MSRIILLALLMISISLAGCQLLPGKRVKHNGPVKSIFGVHKGNDSEFQKKVAADPFPPADSF